MKDQPTNDPNTLDQDWQAFFRELGDSDTDAKADAAGIVVADSPADLGKAVMQAIG